MQSGFYRVTTTYRPVHHQQHQHHQMQIHAAARSPQTVGELARIIEQMSYTIDRMYQRALDIVDLSTQGRSREFFPERAPLLGPEAKNISSRVYRGRISEEQGLAQLREIQVVPDRLPMGYEEALPLETQIAIDRIYTLIAELLRRGMLSFESLLDESRSHSQDLSTMREDYDEVRQKLLDRVPMFPDTLPYVRQIVDRL